MLQGELEGWLGHTRSNLEFIDIHRIQRRRSNSCVLQLPHDAAQSLQPFSSSGRPNVCSIL